MLGWHSCKTCYSLGLKLLLLLLLSTSSSNVSWLALLDGARRNCCFVNLF